MHDTPIHRNNNSLCSFYNAVDILLVYFPISFSFIGNGDNTAGIKSFNMGAADSRNAVRNFHAGHHLCGFHCLVNSLYGFLDINDGSFP